MIRIFLFQLWYTAISPRIIDLLQVFIVIVVHINSFISKAKIYKVYAGAMFSLFKETEGLFLLTVLFTIFIIFLYR